MKRLEIFDSTLRDGAQGEGISFSVQDKLNIIAALDAFGVHYIEAGNPGSNPKDLEFFERAGKLVLKNAKLCAFGSTRRKNLRTEQDENVLSLLKADTPTVSIFGKAWDLHVFEILHASLPENLELVYDTIAYFKARAKEVVFDAEHFFDGYRANPDYALEVLAAAADAGADALCLCDTNGGTRPSDIARITKLTVEKFSKHRIGIHCHNDTGCAVANTLLAVDAGATQVQGTFIGFGERCGNADLSIILPNLQIKQDYICIENGLEKLYETAMRIAEIANVTIPGERPYVGGSAFAHKGGMHIDGVNKLPCSFEHIDPAMVGNTRRFLMSEVSGRTTVLAKLRNIAPNLTKESPETASILARLKELEHYGYQFEAADASFELLVKRELGRYVSHFDLIMYKTTGEFPAPDEDMSSSAMIRVQVDNKIEMTASIGNGPVNALDVALRKALTVFYPRLKRVHLIDYKVRVLDTKEATGAKVRVLIESTDGEKIWTTVGVATDIIQASWIALVDSIEYELNADN